MKLTIPYETCAVEVTGTYEPAAYEDGFLLYSPEFCVEEFELVFNTGVVEMTEFRVHVDDLPLGMVHFKFYEELEKRCIEQLETMKE